MKYLSVCSGIEAASVAFKPLGWEPLAFSEIEAFPRAVLQHHYPDTPLHGDFTELHSQPWIVDADLLCGGTPCQSFSVAGLRKSMGDDRGNLTLQFIKLADAIDDLRRADGREPAFILWENVPGIFSTHDNAFGAFLGGLCGRDAAIPEPADGWPSAGVVDGPTRVAAWRVLDAQHFGLAQRRKRVFVLAKGGAGKWAAADALLPIIEGSEWHPAPGRGKGERVAATIACRAGGGGDLNPETSGGGNLIPMVMATGQASAMSAPTIDMAPTLSCNHEAPILMRMREGKEGGGKGPLVSEDQSLTLATANDQVLLHNSTAYDTLQQKGINHASTQEADTGKVLSDLRKAVGEEAFAQWGLGILDTLQQAEVLQPTLHGEGLRGAAEGKAEVVGSASQSTEDLSGGAVCEMRKTGRERRASQEWRLERSIADELGAYLSQLPQPGTQTTWLLCDLWKASEGIRVLRQALSAVQEVGRPISREAQPASASFQVRRLTPVEAARLQGFPDDYLDITYRGKPAADGNKYKALGNSWAVPVVRWIGKQIDQVRNARLNG